MVGIFRGLHLVQPFLTFLPKVECTDRQIPFGEKVIYMVISIFIFLMCSQLPLYGIHSIARADPFYWMRVILASNHGTVVEPGITPIVTSGLVMRLLAGSKIIEVDNSVREDRALLSPRLPHSDLRPDRCRPHCPSSVPRSRSSSTRSHQQRSSFRLAAVAAQIRDQIVVVLFVHLRSPAKRSSSTRSHQRWGDVTTPPIAASDLLLASAGPGGFLPSTPPAGLPNRAGGPCHCAVVVRERSVQVCGCHRVPTFTGHGGCEEAVAVAAPATRLPVGSLYEGGGARAV